VFEVQSHPITNALVFFVCRLSLPLIYCWLLYIERCIVHSPEMIKNEGFLGFIKSLIEVKELAGKNAREAQNLIAKRTESASEPDANNNRSDDEVKPESKVKKSARTATHSASLVTVVNRLLTSIYLGHHILLISTHFSVHQAYPFQSYPMVRLQSF
jgi:hypothetical protein